MSLDHQEQFTQEDSLTTLTDKRMGAFRLLQQYAQEFLNDGCGGMKPGQQAAYAAFMEDILTGDEQMVDNLISGFDRHLERVTMQKLLQNLD